MAINDAVKGKAVDSKYPCSAIVNKVFEMLNKFNQWIDDIPPTEQPQRFGNKSFRIWHEKLYNVSSYTQ
jgi:serine/threonine-protein phosphatase 2A activator